MNESNEQAQPTEQVMIQIILTVDGQVKVTGPALADKTAFYGLLEVAKDACREMHTPKVLRPQGNFLQGLRMNGKHK
jgi:hypothetical protein